MRRPSAITLVLLGAGVAGGAWFAWPTRSDECAAARARQDKFADEVCSRSSSSSSSSSRSSSRSGWSWGGTSGSSTSTSSSSRGGFGSFFSSSGG